MVAVVAIHRTMKVEEEAVGESDPAVSHRKVLEEDDEEEAPVGDERG